jgi:hypothetical protein
LLLSAVGFSKPIPGPAGRKQVRELVQQILKDETFVTTYINDNTPDRQVIYEDPELGLCICAHLNRGAKEANPHDHGSSWAIYRQAFGETEMSDGELLSLPARPSQAKCAVPKLSPLTQGWRTFTTRANGIHPEASRCNRTHSHLYRPMFGDHVESSVFVVLIGHVHQSTQAAAHHPVNLVGIFFDLFCR